jgi:hypothetical protein
MLTHPLRFWQYPPLNRLSRVLSYGKHVTGTSLSCLYAESHLQCSLPASQQKEGKSLKKEGAYQVETSPHVETMQTPITTVGSESNGHGERWWQFTSSRSPAPILDACLQLTPAPQSRAAPTQPRHRRRLSPPTKTSATWVVHRRSPLSSARPGVRFVRPLLESSAADRPMESMESTLYYREMRRPSRVGRAAPLFPRTPRRLWRRVAWRRSGTCRKDAMEFEVVPPIDLCWACNAPNYMCCAEPVASRTFVPPM